MILIKKGAYGMSNTIMKWTILILAVTIIVIITTICIVQGSKAKKRDGAKFIFRTEVGYAAQETIPGRDI